jgi:hypothetical protein
MDHGRGKMGVRHGSQKKLILWAAFAVILLLSYGCSSTFNAVKPDDSTGHFSQGHVSPEEIKVFKPLAGIAHYHLLYLRTSFTFRDEKYHLFIREMFDNLGLFKKIADRNEMEQFVIKGGLSGAVSSVDDLVSLHRMSRVIGRFLVADALLQKSPAGSGSYTFTIRVLNPRNGETVFAVVKKALNVTGLDEPLLFPVFNALSDWAKKSKALPPEEERTTGPERGI